MSEEIYIDGILAQDYGTPYSKSFYNKNYNLKIGETINMNEEEYTILLTDKQYRTVIDKAQEDINNEWKDKIRNKIKELENKKEQYSEQPLIYHILKSQLEELLGENKNG
jgi:hypothetical protein